MSKHWTPGETWRSPVAVAPKSKNGKTGPVATTSASQVTCPDGTRGTVPCPFLRAGCYAETVGMQPFTTKRLNSNTVKNTTTIARIEASAIDALPADRKLRVHVVGDCRTITSAGIVGAAMVRYEKRHGHKAWTYTHAWHTVPRSAWKGARVYASVHTATDIAAARANGYTGMAIASTERHASRRVYRLLGISAVPCPAQFDSRVQCETCDICMEPDRIAARGLAVVFEPDGRKKSAEGRSLR
jgi:hypothetical protein